MLVIIGAGVIGSMLAFRLAQRGAPVTLVERGGPAYGTTGSSFAWINSNTKLPRDYFELNWAGMRAHRALRDELGEAPWLREGGNLEWATSDAGHAELEARVARLRSWGYAAEWLDRATVRDLEPNLRPEPGSEQAALFADEAGIDGPLLAARLSELATRHGAVPRFRSELTAIERAAGRVRGVRLANGERIAADLVVNCAGPAADRVAALAGRRLPLAPTRGLIVRVSGAADAVGRVLHAPRLHLRPDSGGLLMLHHDDADAAIAGGEPPQRWARALLERLPEYVPNAGAARLSRWSVGVRPIPADERTSAGLLPDLPGYAEIVTHSGITLGPLLGRLVADEILDGTIDPLLAPFRPERFA
jgi:glycine/D-amino acid oxidase-like deaminating enzyme